MITFRELNSVYGAPGDWHYRIIQPDGKVELTSGGDMWRLWQSDNWESLFGVVLSLWRSHPNGTRIQLYIDGLMDTSGKRTAERGARSQIVHADLLVDNALKLSKQEMFEQNIHEFKVTMRDAPELLPDWVPGSLRVRPAPPVWEDLL